MITSNLSEYFYDNILKINRYKNNMYDLLKPGGVVVSSHIFNLGTNSLEKRIFTPDFDICEYPHYRDEWGECALGCSYVKKRK